MKGKLLQRALAATKLLWRRHGSTVVLVGGMVSVGAGTILACKATLKLDKRLAKHEETKKLLDQTKEKMDVAVYRKELAKVKKDTAVDLGKLYLVPIGLVGGGMLMIATAHRMDRKELAASVALGSAIKQRFDDYRERVKQELGEDKEEMVYNGVSEVDVTTIPPEDEGEPVTETQFIREDGLSPYQRYFSAETQRFNGNWKGNYQYDKAWVKTYQADLNDLLDINKFLTFAEALKFGGFEPSLISYRAGWIKHSKDSDGYIDLGVFDKNGNVKTWQEQLYKREGKFLFDYNVDGDVIAKLPLEKY